MEKSNVLSVSQLNMYVRSLLESNEHLKNFYLCGEISNFVNHYKSGHLYMTLKDENGAIKAVMFKRDAIGLKFVPQNGMKVICRGRVSLYERDGSYQFYIISMQPDGAGALAIAFEQLKEKLYKEGLFDEQHKKPIPKYPKKIALVTSDTGAAVQDIINVLTRRYPSVYVTLFPVQVQGELAAPQITSALKIADTMDFDVIITGRGGGSAEDLWAFNDETLARTIFALNTPIISAVGHEIDFTICDFVADLRAPTPSAAAELAVPDKMDLKIRLSSIKLNLHTLINRKFADSKMKIDAIKAKPCMQDASYYIDRRRQDCDNLTTLLNQTFDNYFIKKKNDYDKLNSSLKALSPLATLSRGFAAIRLGEQYINSVDDLNSGDEIQLKFCDGEKSAVVK